VERHTERLEDGHVLDADFPDQPVWVDADVGRLEQVLENLLSNAVKYSPAGGAVEITLTPAPAGTTLAVQDTGIGLPDGTAERIFEPFGRAPNAAARNLPGLGLGLYICRNIVELHGGRIWAESAGDGHGATLRVWLPTTQA
jgi:two-component system, OmpR family, sensor kinase